MNKIISVILIWIVALSQTLSVMAANEGLTTDYAEIVFDEFVAKKNISGWAVAETLKYEFAVRDGKTGILRTPRGNEFFLCIGVNDDFLYSETGVPVAVTVEYYDEGKGKFTLRYDSERSGIWASPNEIVYMTDAKQWKRHTFYLDDCMLKNGLLHGMDIEIGLWAGNMGASADGIVIRSVRIEKSFVKHPIDISIETGYEGNILGQNDSGNIDIVLKNITDNYYETDVSWKLKNEQNTVIADGNAKTEISGKETKSIGIKCGIEKFGLYQLDVSYIATAKGDGKTETVTDSKTIKISKALTSEAGEMKSDYVYVCTHLERYDQPASIETISRAGIGGIRNEYQWRFAEPEKKKYEFNEHFQERISLLEKNTLDMLCILAFSNPLYITNRPYSDVVVPYYDEEIEGYADYAAYMAKSLKGKFNKFEVWNEYNLQTFNSENRSPEHYVKILKAVYPAIKNENPDAKVYAMCSAGADAAFLERMLKAGAKGYFDAITIHPYDWGGGFRHDNFKKNVETIHNLMKEYGCDDKPVIFSEIGWTSGNCSTGVSSKEQAVNLIHMAVISKAYGLAEEIYLYDFQDDGPSPDDQESNFGLTHYHGGDDPLSAKESYLAVAAFNKYTAGGFETVSSVEKDNLETAAHFFKKTSGEQFGILWSKKTSGDSLGLNLGCNKIDVHDMYGNKLETLTSQDGTFSFSLADEPIYIFGDFKNYTEALTQITLSENMLTAVSGDEFSIELIGENIDKCDIELNLSDFDFTVVDVDKSNFGKAIIKLKVSENANGSYPIVIKASRNGECLYVSKNIINIGNPIKVSLSTKQYDSKNKNRWQLEIIIENLTNNMAVSGKCTLSEPLEYADYVKQTSFENIMPKETKKIYVNLPEMVKKRTQTLKGKIALDYGYETEFEQTLDFTSAQFIAKKPEIDGVISDGEWLGTWMCADDVTNVFYIDKAYEGQWDGKEDLSLSSLKLMWDDKNLYLSATVKDDMHWQKYGPDTLWKGDSIQFGIEDKNRSVVAPTNNYFTEIGVALLPTGPTVYRFSTLYENKIGIVENCQVSVSRSGSDTVYELAIPWDELFYGNYQIDESKVLGFSMLVNDNDSGYRYGVVEYNSGISGIGIQKNALLFGRMKLNK